MKSGSSLIAILGGIAILAAGFGVGFYYLGGQNKNSDNASTPGATTPPSADQTAALPSSVRRPPADAGEYTAPGAPTVEIEETPVTSATPASTPAAQSATDSEASQTGLPTATPDDGSVSSSTATGTQNATTGAAPDQNNPNPGSTPDPNANSLTTDPNAAKPASTPVGQNSVNSQNGSGNANTDNQSGTTLSANLSTHSSDQSGSGVLYHVQAGAFGNEKNADILASALQHKGYAAMTVHQVSNGQDSYVVQVGAYSSGITADSVVGALQHDGFPASVSHSQ